MGFGWDVDDDIYDEDEEIDEEHPYGEDEALETEDEELGDEQEEEQQGVRRQGNGSKKQKDDNQDEKTGEGKKDDGNPADKKKDANPIEMRGEAKNNNMPEFIFPMYCPICKQKSLFSDPVNAMGKRLSVTIAFACVGMINADNALSSLHLRCMNKKCKSYWKKTGEYFIIKPTGTLEKKKSIFHIDR